MKGGLHIKNDDLRGIHSRIASPYAMSESKELDPRAWESPEVRLRVSSDVRVYLAQTKTGGFLNLGICLGLELDLVVLAVLLHLGEGGDDAVDDAKHDNRNGARHDAINGILAPHETQDKDANRRTDEATQSDGRPCSSPSRALQHQSG